VGVRLARLSRVPYGSKKAWMLTGEDVRVRGQKRRMREEMTNPNPNPDQGYLDFRLKLAMDPGHAVERAGG